MSRNMRRKKIGLKMAPLIELSAQWERSVIVLHASFCNCRSRMTLIRTPHLQRIFKKCVVQEGLFLFARAHFASISELAKIAYFITDD
jgi:hypothetical protein